jgi:hypothetical protein
MKLKTCITILWISLGLATSAQRTKETLREKHEEQLLQRGFFGISAGASIPVLEFGSTDFSVASSGYATLGNNWRFQFSYEAFEMLGVSITYNIQQWRVNSTALASDLQAANTNVQVQQLSMEDYRLSGMFLGVFMPLRMPYTTFELKAQVGYNTGNLPELNYRVRISNGDIYRIQIKEVTASDPAYLIGMQLKRRLYKDLLITGYANFLYSEQRYENIFVYNLTQGFSVRARDYTQYYHAINAGLGLALQFN